MPEVQLKYSIENHDNFFSETYISNHSIFPFIETVSGDSPLWVINLTFQVIFSCTNLDV